MKRLVLLYILFFSFSISAQMSELEIMPHHINFMNEFERSKTVQISNHGISVITIDSISYNSSMLYIRKNNFSEFPITLMPDSSISINVILSNYFVLDNNDSTTTILLYNSSNKPIQELIVNISFAEMNHGMNGIIRGSVKDSLNNNLSGAKVLFFFDGIYLIDSTFTDSNGNYETELRSGKYFVATKKDGYYMQYSNLKYSPLDADFIEVRKDSPQTVEFILESETETNLSISGVVYDIVTDESIGEAIVVVRKGTHTPTKIATSITTDPFRSYSVIANSKGEFVISNIQSEGDYYLEAFSQYYIPGYYNHMNEHESFWQNADSIDVFDHVIDKNIYLDRDSSYGGGVAQGRIRVGNPGQSDSLNNSLVFAISTLNSKVYNYNFSQSSGNFALSDLPSGSYKLITDKIGYESSVSTSFVIDTTQDTVGNIDLLLLPTTVKQTTGNIKSFSLSQNYPNPFNPSTIIEFSINTASHVTLAIYNLLGQKVAVLVDDNYSSGVYEVSFDASQLPSGIYIYQLSNSYQVIAKKMELLK